MKVALLVVVCLVAGAFSAPSAHIDSALRRVLKAKGTANIFISFKGGNEPALNSLRRTTFATRDARLNGVAAALQSYSQRTQENVLAYLNKVHNAGVQSFWINNRIYVQNADSQLVESLALFPEISDIVEEEIIQLDPVLDAQYHSSKEGRPLNEWGVQKIQAPEAWGMDGGNSGEGVVVANIDTGVRYTHETLRSNFRGSDYGWFDPYTGSSNPIDQNGHGTHTMGTIAGANGIGVAPGATWIACRGCDTSSCSTRALTECGQFMVCPTLPNGGSPDCSKAPHLVSNSWGGGQGQSFYNSIIDAWYEAGIVPLFSNGNSGPYCGSANSPADYHKAIGIGSTTSSDALSSFSSKGPSVFGTIKPDTSAPGSSVYSAYHTSDRAYATLSGTSMACPHAAGVVALLKSRRPDLSAQDSRSYLIHGNAQSELIKPGFNCGGIDEDTFPNNAFGHGRINAFNSLLRLLEDSKALNL